MHQLIEARIDENGQVHLTEPIKIAGRKRAYLILLDESVPSLASSSSSPTPTVTITGGQRYRLVSQLGSGGMGKVFRALDNENGQTVCIKKLLPGFGRELIVQEWKSLERLDSPFVVKFIDTYEIGYDVFLVMEFVQADTLAERLTQPLSPLECIWLGYTLMQGIKSIHDVNLIHCDLKPLNILIEDVTVYSENKIGWVPKIIDFGLAILDDHDADGVFTAAMRLAGTPAYMAPEQAKGLVLSPACDIYSFGLILWEAIMNRRPFKGSAQEMVNERRQQKASLRIKPIPPGIPKALTTLIADCTCPDPILRPTADRVIRELQDCLASV
jgi:serine/threonine protein kinase